MAAQKKGETKTLLTATGTGVGPASADFELYTTFQATNNGSGTTNIVDIEVSNDNTQWITMGTISLTSNDETDGFAANAAWKYVRANATTVTAGTVTVTMGG